MFFDALKVSVEAIDLCLPINSAKNYWWGCMTKSEWASWMQAVGSVIAIAVAIIFPYLLQRKQYRQQKRDHANEVARQAADHRFEIDRQERDHEAEVQRQNLIRDEARREIIYQRESAAFITWEIVNQSMQMHFAAMKSNASFMEEYPHLFEYLKRKADSGGYFESSDYRFFRTIKTPNDNIVGFFIQNFKNAIASYKIPVANDFEKLLFLTDNGAKKLVKITSELNSCNSIIVSNIENFSRVGGEDYKNSIFMISILVWSKKINQLSVDYEEVKKLMNYEIEIRNKN